MKNSFKIFVSALSVSLIATTAIVFATENQLFSDVSESDWFYSYIQTMKNKNIISGYPDGTFKPGNNVNRAELSKILAGYFDSLENQINSLETKVVNLENQLGSNQTTTGSTTDSSNIEVLSNTISDNKIVGEVKNNGNQEVRFVELQVRYYDAVQKLVDSGTTFSVPADLDAEETGTFTFYITDIPYNSYEIEVVD